MSDIPTLAEALGVSALPAFDGARRVHRIGGHEDQQPAPPPREAEMPSGVYPRKPSTNGDAAVTDATIEVKPEPKRKAKAKKRAKKRAGVTLVSVKARASRGPATAATFVVNDRGAMGILAGEQRIDLDPADVKRLEQFLTNSKGLRK